MFIHKNNVYCSLLPTRDLRYLWFPSVLHSLVFGIMYLQLCVYKKGTNVCCTRWPIFSKTESVMGSEIQSTSSYTSLLLFSHPNLGLPIDLFRFQTTIFYVIQLWQFYGIQSSPNFHFPIRPVSCQLWWFLVTQHLQRQVFSVLQSNQNNYGAHPASTEYWGALFRAPSSKFKNDWCYTFHFPNMPSWCIHTLHF